MVDTGSGLRFTVALDRGGDIVEAFYQSCSLAYLTPNGYRPPRQPLHRDEDWLAAWPAGLLTSCGPRYIGPGREEDGLKLALHGQHSNTPAALLELKNPNPGRGDLDMRLGLVIRDTQMYGPVVEVRRQIACRLGSACDPTAGRSGQPWKLHRGPQLAVPCQPGVSAAGLRIATDVRRPGQRRLGNEPRHVPWPTCPNRTATSTAT